MRLTRRGFTSAAVASFAIRGFNRKDLAQGAKQNLKVGGQFPTTNPASIAMEEACAEIRKQSNGVIDIQFFPNAQLGSDVAMQGQVRQGILDMMTQSGLTLQQLVPVAGISGMAFAFKDYSQVWSAVDGDLGAEIRSGMEKFGLYAFPKCLDSGYRHVTTSTKPIDTVDDFKGLKIRVPPSPVWVTMFAGLGASPSSISINELYSSLQTKIVDGQENPLIIIDSVKLY
jgi:TRAP-type transport system periplasmic protein